MNTEHCDCPKCEAIRKRIAYLDKRLLKIKHLGWVLDFFLFLSFCCGIATGCFMLIKSLWAFATAAGSLLAIGTMYHWDKVMNWWLGPKEPLPEILKDDEN